VTNLFQKILRPYKKPPPPGLPDSGPFQRTIGYREYVQLVGPLRIAFGWDEEELVDTLQNLLVQINYLGKRGGFMQLTSLPSLVSELPPGFVMTTHEPNAFVVNGTLQTLDDCSPELSFDKASIYSGQKIKLGKERITRNIVLPYRLARSSKSFSLYIRID